MALELNRESQICREDTAPLYIQIWKTPKVNMSRLKTLFQSSTSKNGEFFRAILAVQLAALLLFFGWSETTRALPSPVGPTWLLEAVTVFITCLTKTRTCYNINILNNPLIQRYLSDSKNLVKEGGKRERCGAKLCFLQKEQLYRYEDIYISSICLSLEVIQLKYCNYVTLTFNENRHIYSAPSRTFLWIPFILHFTAKVLLCILLCYRQV